MYRKFTPAFCSKRDLLMMNWEIGNRKLLQSNSRAYDGKRTRRSLFKDYTVAKRKIRAYHYPFLTHASFMRDYWDTPPMCIDPNQAITANIQHGFLHRLEKRLDVVLYRCNFCDSIDYAVDIIKRGKVKVNSRVETKPGKILESGDLISVDPKSTSIFSGRATIDQPESEITLEKSLAFVPEYLEVDYHTCSAVFIRDPLIFNRRIEIPTPYPPEVYESAYNYYKKKFDMMTKSKTKKFRVDGYINVSAEEVSLKKEFRETYDKINGEKPLSARGITRSI